MQWWIFRKNYFLDRIEVTRRAADHIDMNNKRYQDFFLPDNPNWKIKNLLDFLNCSVIAALEDDDE